MPRGPVGSLEGGMGLCPFQGLQIMPVPRAGVAEARGIWETPGLSGSLVLTPPFISPVGPELLPVTQLGSCSLQELAQGTVRLGGKGGRAAALLGGRPAPGHARAPGACQGCAGSALCSCRSFHLRRAPHCLSPETILPFPEHITLPPTSSQLLRHHT